MGTNKMIFDICWKRFIVAAVAYICEGIAASYFIVEPYSFIYDECLHDDEGNDWRCRVLAGFVAVSGAISTLLFVSMLAVDAIFETKDGMRGAPIEKGLRAFYGAVTIMIFFPAIGEYQINYDSASEWTDEKAISISFGIMAATNAFIILFYGLIPEKDDGVTEEQMTKSYWIKYVCIWLFASWGKWFCREPTDDALKAIMGEEHEVMTYLLSLVTIFYLGRAYSKVSYKELLNRFLYDEWGFGKMLNIYLCLAAGVTHGITAYVVTYEQYIDDYSDNDDMGALAQFLIVCVPALALNGFFVTTTKYDVNAKIWNAIQKHDAQSDALLRP